MRHQHQGMNSTRCLRDQRFMKRHLKFCQHWSEPSILRQRRTTYPADSSASAAAALMRNLTPIGYDGAVSLCPTVEPLDVHAKGSFVNDHRHRPTA